MAKFCELIPSNMSKILKLFFNGKFEIITGIALLRIIQQVNEKGACVKRIGDLPGDTNCFMCWEKENLFKEVWQEHLASPTSSGIDSTEDGLPLDYDLVWKVVKGGLNLSDVTIEDDAVLGKLSHVEMQLANRDPSMLKEESWKTLCSAVIGDLLKYKEEDLVFRGDASRAHSFMLKSNLPSSQLSSHPFMYHHCRITDDSNFCSVLFDICRTCFGSISEQDYLTPEPREVTDLVSHVILSVENFSDVIFEVINKLNFTKSLLRSNMPTRPPEPVFKPMTVTVVCENNENASNETSRALTQECPSVSKNSHFVSSPITVPLTPPITVPLSGVGAPKPTSLVNRSLYDANGQVLKTVVVTLPSQGRNVIKSLPTLTQASRQHNSTFPIVKIIGKNNFSSQTKSSIFSPNNNCSSGTLVQTMASSRVASDEKRLSCISNVQKFSVTTINKAGGEVGSKNRYILKVTSSKCKNGPRFGVGGRLVGAGGQVRRLVGAGGQVRRLVRAGGQVNGFTKLPTVAKHNLKLRDIKIETNGTEVVKESPDTDVDSKTATSKDGLQTEASSNRKTRNLKTNKETGKFSPKDATNDKKPPHLKTNKFIEQDNSSHAPPGGKSLRSKTSNKKKQNCENGVPMESIVFNYLTSSGSKKDDVSSSYNSKRPPTPRRKHCSTNKIIPVPYESHYLCISETLAKKGWKAYWFIKCRCARSVTKKGKSRDKPLSSDVPSTPKQDSGSTGAASRHNTRKRSAASKEMSPKNAKIVRISNVDASVKNCGSMNTSNNSSKFRESALGNHCDMLSVTITKLQAEMALNALRCRFDGEVSSSRPHNHAELLKDKNNEFPRESGSNSVKIPELCASLRDETPNNMFSSTGEVSLRHNASASMRPFTDKVDALLEPSFKGAARNHAILSSDSAHAQTRLLTANSCSDDGINLRKDKVNKLHQSLLGQSSKSTKPVLFAQYFEETDEQPSCFDIVAVDSSPTYKEAQIAVKQRRSESSLLLNSTELSNSYAAKASARKNNDLDTIWAHGKTKKFFLEKILQKKMRKVPKLSNCRTTLQKSLFNFRSKVYRHHSRRPKAKPTTIRRKVIPVEEAEAEEDGIIGFGPYKLPWKIPSGSVSSVVEKLQSLWNIDDEDLLDDQPYRTGMCDVVDISSEQITHALAALRNNNEVVTFSSERITKNDGKDAILRIKRTFVDPVYSPSNQHIDPCENKNDSIVSPHPSALKDHNCSLPEVESDVLNPAKILLKLRKTGEVSGSAIYSIPSGADAELKKINEKCDGVAETSGSNYCDVDECRTEDQRSQSVGHEYDCPAEAKTKHFIVGEQDFDEVFDPEDNGNPVLFEKDDICRHSSFSDNVQDIKDKQVSSPCVENKTCCGSDGSAPSPHHSSLNASTDSESPSFLDISQTFSEFENCSPVSGDILSSTRLGESPALSRTSSLFEPSSTEDKIASNLDSDINAGLEVNWEDKMMKYDVFEEMLKSLPKNSLDVLEQVFIFENRPHISSLDLMRRLRSKPERDRNKGRNKGFVDRLNGMVNDEESLSCYSSNLCDLSLLSSMESPENIRGISYSKKSAGEDNAFPPPVMFSDSDNEVVASPNVACQDEVTHDDSLKSLHPDHQFRMKSCNVLLQPLEGMLESYRSDKQLGSSELPTSSSSFNLSLDKGEIKRLLKNQALNGSYWKPIGWKSPISTGSHRRLRDRNKKQPCSEEKESVVDADEEDLYFDEEVEAVTEPEIPLPKRKRLDGIPHYKPSDDVILNVADQIRKKFIPVNNSLATNQCDDKNPYHLNCQLMRSLFDSDLDLHQVKTWIIESSLPQPRPLLSPYFIARKQALKASSVKARSYSHEETAGSLISDDVSNGHERKKLKDRDTTESKKPSSVDNEEFEALRRSLFRARHPNYKGELCNGAILKKLPGVAAVTSSLPLLRVDADEAKKQSSSSLTSDVLLESKSNTTKNKTKQIYQTEVPSPVKKRGRTCSPSKRRSIDINPSVVVIESLDRNNGVLRNSFPLTSSRGRTLKSKIRDSLHNRSSSPLLRPTKSLFNQNAELGGARSRSRGRFVNKHSTMGAYIKRVIESGMYD